ncbi:hypothetical protein [Vibrio diabolicus]|uniref:hypothetical protein n=1 Tax=Vibrio diabolicus TaxID=50719 RepID=UPI00293FFA58|nr:hypothetical protein [Vibrio diabolicus]MDV5047562.1 hypothetical protein [Vibrio diabolicus]
MNFGRVYTILYSLVSVSIFLPSYVSAQDFIVDIEDAYRNLKSSYVRLNNVVESCLDKKDRKIVISDTWLKSQPIEKKKAILFFLQYEAESNCVQQAELDYLQAAYKLAILGDSQAINEYIQLNKFGAISEDIQSQINSVDREELSRLLKLEKYQTPFDIFSAF